MGSASRAAKDESIGYRDFFPEPAWFQDAPDPTLAILMAQAVQLFQKSGYEICSFKVRLGKDIFCFDLSSGEMSHDLIQWKDALNEILSLALEHRLCYTNQAPVARANPRIVHMTGLEFPNFIGFPLESGSGIHGAVLLVDGREERTPNLQDWVARANT